MDMKCDEMWQVKYLLFSDKKVLTEKEFEIRKKDLLETYANPQLPDSILYAFDYSMKKIKDMNYDDYIHLASEILQTLFVDYFTLLGDLEKMKERKC